MPVLLFDTNGHPSINQGRRNEKVYFYNRTDNCHCVDGIHRLPRWHVHQLRRGLQRFPIKRISTHRSTGQHLPTTARDMDLTPRRYDPATSRDDGATGHDNAATRCDLRSTTWCGLASTSGSSPIPTRYGLRNWPVARSIGARLQAESPAARAGRKARLVASASSRSSRAA